MNETEALKVQLNVGLAEITSHKGKPRAIVWADITVDGETVRDLGRVMLDPGDVLTVNGIEWVPPNDDA